MSSIPNFPPDAVPTTYTIEFSETLAPYLRWFYSQKGLPGETIEQYMVRALTIYGKQYLSQQVTIAIAMASKAATTAQVQAAQEQIRKIE